MTDRAARGVYTARRGRGEAWIARALSAVLVGLFASACSIAVPVVSAPDDLPTGAVGLKAGSPLSAELGGEDWRRAKGALAVALDPQGNGSTVNWDNPETAVKGSFTPVGQPYVQNDEICRAFLAHVQGQASTSSLQGSACRLSGGEWGIKDVRPWKKPA